MIRKILKVRLPCRHPEHNPPIHILIPPGQVWEHSCPGCGRKVTMHGSGVTWG